MTTERSPERRPVSQIVADAAGATVGAGVLFLINAVLMLLAGICAVYKNELLVSGVPDYVFKFNATVWGWVHIAVAILMGLAAIGLLRGVKWARVAVVVMASVSIVAMFLVVPYYWVWAIVVIALNVIAIWVVAKYWSTERESAT